MYSKNCKQCGAAFQSKAVNALFCNIECKLESRKVDASCDNCSTTFRTKNKCARFCSNKCSQEHRYKPNKVELACDNCGEIFIRSKGRIRGAVIGNFCTRGCQTSFISKNKGDRSFKWSRVDVKCAGCGLTFEKQPSQIKDGLQSYCTSMCYRRHIYNEELSEDERVRRRGFAGYSIWRTAVFERDKYKCVACEGTGKYLEAHHILNFAEHPELRIEVANGATLCKMCHKSFHSKYGTRKNTTKQFEEFLKSQ